MCNLFNLNRSLLAACLLLPVAMPAFAATYEPVDGNKITIIDGDTVALPCPIVGIGCGEKGRASSISH
jgi:hypothetical protein